MRDHIKDEPESAATDLTLTKTGSLAFASLPASTSLLESSVRQIKAQLVADQIFERIQLGQSEQHLLLHTIQALDTDCLPTFLRQFSKRVEASK